jgi:hypothetical protein
MRSSALPSAGEMESRRNCVKSNTLPATGSRRRVAAARLALRDKRGRQTRRRCAPAGVATAYCHGTPNRVKTSHHLPMKAARKHKRPLAHRGRPDAPGAARAHKPGGLAATARAAPALAELELLLVDVFDVSLDSLTGRPEAPG